MSTKVFVGNLSFTTTGQELQQAFEHVGKIVSANIIFRGRRSRGYGFVEFENEADAHASVTAMHKKEIAGRQVNVEVAKARDESLPDEAPVQRQARPPRGPRGGYGDGAPRRARFNAAPQDGNAAAGGQQAGQFRAPRRARGPRRTGGDRGATRPPRASQQGGQSGALSKSTLFVANLPFTTDDAELNKLFAAYNVKSAHVVKMRNGRSRGYGFVEFHDEATQTKAQTEMEGKEVESANGPRQLSVKVAMADQPHRTEDVAGDVKAE